MILLSKQQFGVATHHRLADPQAAESELSPGLVVEIGIEFETWMGGRKMRAEAFLDPGADCSIISRRWIREQASAGRNPILTPWTDPDGLLLEQAHVSIGSWRAPLGDPGRPVWIYTQGDEAEQIGSMPGYEDLLSGRDFLSQHGLLVVIDGLESTFSLLVPDDSDNQIRRHLVLETLAPTPDL